MSKGGGNTKTQTTTEPWSGVKPYLTSGYKDAQALYKQGAPAYYPGQATAPMSSYSKQALDATAQRAAYGSDVTRAAQSQLTNTINGDYLNSNPYLQGAIDAAVRPVTEAFTGSVMPGIDSNFSTAGRYGSGMQQGAYNDANQTLARQVGDIGTNMSYQNYGDERQRQMQAMLFAPEMARQDYVDLGMLGQAGQGYDQYNQNLINADIEKYNYNQNSDWNFLNDYIGLLNGATGSASTTTAPNQSGGVGGALTGGIGGALSGAAAGSVIPGFGTALGAIFGGLGGAAGGFY
jgi:hypothetical protein